MSSLSACPSRPAVPLPPPWRSADCPCLPCSPPPSQVISALLAFGADVHACGGSALLCAAWHGHSAAVRLLLQAGADVHAQADEALVVSCAHGFQELVELLLQAGADLHAREDAAVQVGGGGGCLHRGGDIGGMGSLSYWYRWHCGY